MKNNPEQAWKEEARKAYQDQQSQDNEGGCRESIGFVQGYIAAKKSDFEKISNGRKLSYKYYGESEQLKIDRKLLYQEIKTLKEQFAEAIELLRYVQQPKNTDEWVDCGKEVDKFLEKQNKENKDEK